MKTDILTLKRAAEEIRENRELILSSFEKSLKSRVAFPEGKAGEKFTSLIHHQIDHLVESLIQISMSEKTISHITKEHSKLISGKKDVSIDIIISEYIVFKDVIFDFLGQKGTVDSTASNIIWQYIVNAIRVAVMEFEMVRQTEKQELNKQLETSHSLNKTISHQIVDSNENEERYKTLVQGVEDYAVFTTDTKGFIESWNPGAARMKGYTAEEAIGKHFSMLYTEEGRERDEPMQHLQVALIEGRYRGEGIRRRKNGEHYLADVYIRPIFKNGKHLGFAKIVADMTEREKLLQASNISEAEIVDLKSERAQRENFVATLSHDLRGPLSVARASIELLFRHMDPRDKKVKYVDKAILSIDRTNRMISNLLDYKRINAGESVILNIIEFDIVRLIKIVCDDFKTLGAEIVLTTNEEEIWGEWDGEALRRILENLISNALKYGDNSFPVDIEIQALEKSVNIKVHNMGQTISIEDQKLLFQQFRRADSAIKHKPGWGIGLSLVKAFTEAHGGEVQVDSYNLIGTTFTVTLPKKH